MSPENEQRERPSYKEPTQEFMDSLIEVILSKPESFLYVKEVLTRIGIKAKTEPRLCQSCHILKKRDRYYIMHFKELFLLDGKTANFSEDDRARRNSIADLLEDWKLVTIKNRAVMGQLRAPADAITILSHADKSNYILESKYQIGKKRRNDYGN